jgi:outer membrane protein OmpA-like peptidoglycan-associated protein
MKGNHAVFPEPASESRVRFFRMSLATVQPSRTVLSQQQPAARLQPSKGSTAVAPSAGVPVVDPPFLRRPILFEPNSVEPDPTGRDVLKRAATWLREHREARVLIVGSCDSSGSETCTHTLAEGRGSTIQRLLRVSGISSDQIVGVKGWEKVDGSCRAADIKCQQSNRSVRIFMASSVATGEKP